ncbi:hypothetical protein AEYBE204_05900 [Asticcacaulis sp. YBE204]|nr:hypothetical protein AEYBE204_05900 [Asticcacaulis sp. YBE204]
MVIADSLLPIELAKMGRWRAEGVTEGDDSEVQRSQTLV